MILKDHDVLDVKEQVCAASLIASDLALTAAHCVRGHKTEKYFVRAGEWDTSSSQELFSSQVHTVLLKVITDLIANLISDAWCIASDCA